MVHECSGGRAAIRICRTQYEPELLLHADGSYRFLHDRVQEAAYSLIPETRARRGSSSDREVAVGTHPSRRAGRRDFRNGQSVEPRRGVDQLTRGARAIGGAQPDRWQACEGVRGYASALTYLASGAALLAEDCWERRHDLAFALELNRAECEYLTGQLASAEERLSVLATHAADSRRAGGCCLLTHGSVIDARPGNRAIEVGLDFLREMGVEWSPHPSEEEVRREYERIWSLLGTRAIEELIDLPLMSEPSSLATLDVLTKLAIPHSPPIAICTSWSAVARSISAWSMATAKRRVYAYVWLGAIAGPQFGDYQAGCRFGRIGYELVEQRGWKRLQPGTYFVFASVVIPGRGLSRAVVICSVARSKPQIAR